MKLLTLINIILIFLSGCSSKNLQPKSFNKNPQEIVTQNNQIFDEENIKTSLYKVEFIRETSPNKKHSLVFYINTLPYEKTFDLCAGNNNKIITKIIQENGKTTTESDTTFDCSGKLKIHDVNDQFFSINYDFNFLIGFNIENINGVNIKLPNIQHIGSFNNLVKKDATSDLYRHETKSEYEIFYIDVQRMK